MTPPIKMLENTEVFDAFDEAGGQPLRISAPGRGVLTVTDDDPEQDGSENELDLDEAAASVKAGLDEIRQGKCVSGRESIDHLKVKYGL